VGHLGREHLVQGGDGDRQPPGHIGPLRVDDADPQVVPVVQGLVAEGDGEAARRVAAHGGQPDRAGYLPERLGGPGGGRQRGRALDVLQVQADPAQRSPAPQGVDRLDTEAEPGDALLPDLGDDLVHGAPAGTPGRMPRTSVTTSGSGSPGSELTTTTRAM
jgi:hypothetical protein